MFIMKYEKIIIDDGILNGGFEDGMHQIDEDGILLTNIQVMPVIGDVMINIIGHIILVREIYVQILLEDGMD